MFSGDNLLYLLTMLEAIEKVKQFISPFANARNFFYKDDQLHFHAVSHLLLAIGEESKKLEKGLKEAFPAIPWKLMTGMRNRLSHDYRGIDFNLVFATANNEMEPLKLALLKMIEMMPFDKGELEAALNSQFYKHLGYLRKFL
ncbi:MAG: DUF86 domain-containing protein [Saprospiraceae bacterium]|nr:DUF86 domain-containing protein [Saprospiraceae bacterium]MCF8248766.1 DUF86 domain-containing protein [Saprospiraceae bacterium]MCF8278744.1 DUF86 domain-containing protein [Bacteroidales bacterium]MCF8310544.1 DUF86 domain-containing protein [Saprospiraceae bacterium]MCF8439103.1 DUF86 domain-containing protein [Saprospiraceae bacterium]